MILFIALVLCQLIVNIKGDVKLQYQDRILNGVDTVITDVPYIVSIQYQHQHYCGGSIIRTNVIATAAHCLIGYNPKDLSVLAGTSNLKDTTGIRKNVKKIIPHDDYNEKNFDYDFGLIILETELRLQYDKIEPIPLKTSFIPPGIHVFSAGWGYLQESSEKLPNFLQSINLTTMSTDDCYAGTGYRTYISDRSLCTAVNPEHRDDCQGDSGGPLSEDGELIGVVSWGVGCGRKPGVFTRISSVYEWTRYTVKNLK